MIGRMVKEDMLEPLNFENIPNFQHINEQFVNPAYDPDNAYSVPYTWGTVGIIYNTTMVDGDVDSWDILWDARYMGDILMFANSRDAFAIAQKRLGYSFNSGNADELEKAAESLKEQKPLVQAYVMDEIFDKMQAGEAALAPYYAGDAITMIADNPDLAFAFPKEGTNRFSHWTGADDLSFLHRHCGVDRLLCQKKGSCYLLWGCAVSAPAVFF